MSKEIVTVKIQRPLFSSDSEYSKVLSYVVDDYDEQTSNPVIESMSKKDIKKLFGDYYKIYWSAEYRKGKKLKLIEPTKEDEWV